MVEYALRITSGGNIGIGTAPGVVSGMSKYLTLSSIAADGAVGLELQGNRSGSDQIVARLSFINLGMQTATTVEQTGCTNSNS